MTLVHCSNLPSFSRIAQEGVLFYDDKEIANTKSERTNIALLNMMPDAALEATERQFIRLLGKAQSSKNICFYPFSLNYDKGSKKIEEHIKQHYQTFEELQKTRIDALIISGANVPLGEMNQAPFWQPLTKIFDWSLTNNTPTLFTCLASHCAVEYFYDERRQLLPQKCWGVFEHDVMVHKHKLVHNLPEKIMVPHSRMNTLPLSSTLKKQLHILIQSEDIGFHMAVSKKHPNFLFFQGHPEYDAVSLLKEHKREIKRYIAGEIEQYPPLPENYYSPSQQLELERYQTMIMSEKNKKQAEQLLTEFPQEKLTQHIQHSWHQPAITLIENWLKTL